MCVSVAVGLAAANLLNQKDMQRRALHAQQDSIAAAEAVKTQAAQTANERLALRRRALSANSLVVGEGATTAGMSAGGRSTLGGP